MLLNLRDGHVLNFIFDSAQQMPSKQYEECSSNGPGGNDSHQVLRFDEILDGDVRFDTEFEVQDRAIMYEPGRHVEDMA